MLYQETFRLWQLHKRSHRSIRSLVAQSRFQNKPQLLALLSRVIEHRDLLQIIVDRSNLFQRETHLNNDLALILIYDQIFGTKVRGKFKGIFKRNQTFLDQCLEELVNENHLTSINELLQLTKRPNRPTISIPRYVRINLLKTTSKKVRRKLKELSYRRLKVKDDFQENFVKLKPNRYFVDPLIENLLVFFPNTKFFGNEIYENRRILLMDKASCLPCQALSPPPGSVVLDACAAPGNKTICLANSLDNRGILYAIEKNARRFRELKSNLRSAGVRCAQLFNEDFLQSTIPKDEIEFILLDPSCSGSGIPHRNDSEEKIDEERLSRLSNLQHRMIVHSLTEFPKLKRLTYSTCSIHRQENEDVVEKILDEFEEKFRLVDFLPQWPCRGETSRTSACLRASPSQTLTNGFFLACFERIDS